MVKARAAMSQWILKTLYLQREKGVRAFTEVNTRGPQRRGKVRVG